MYATKDTIQEIGEAGIRFQVFLRLVSETKWIWMPAYNSIVCDLNYITELVKIKNDGKQAGFSFRIGEVKDHI